MERQDRNEKRNIIWKATSVILAFTLCVTAFTGCGKKKSAEDAIEEAKKIDKNCIFKEESYENILGNGDKIKYIGHAGERIIAICQSVGGTFKYTSFKSDGSDVQSYDFGGKEDDYIVLCDFDKEGNAYMIYNEQKEKEEYTRFILKVGPTGEVVYKEDISQEFPSDDYNNLRCLAWTDKYGLVCGTSDGVQTFDEKNGFKVLVDKKVLKGLDGLTNVIEFSDNKLFVNYIDSNYEMSYVIVDAENKKIEKNIGGVGKNDYYNFFADVNGNLYAEGISGIYKYNQEADKLDKLLDFTDSSIGSDEINVYMGIVALSDKEIIATSSTDEGASYSFVKLTKVNPEDVADKTVITLSGMTVDSDVRNQILKFNRTNDKYTIKIIDYAELYGYDYDTIKKQFNLDLTSGKAADIICFSGMDSSVKKYIDKGILLDLTPAFDKGGPLGDMEILPNIAEMMKYDGKTYTFIPTFDVSTYVVKSEYANGKNSLTYDDCDALIKNAGMDYKSAFGSFEDRTTFCTYGWAYYGDEFIDIENKKCNFDSPEFVDFLNFVNNFSENEEEIDCINDYEIDEYYAEGRGIFYGADFRNIWEYAKLKQNIFNGDVELIGYPNNTGKNMAMIQGTAMAINSKTEHLDVVYDLIRSLMNADKQRFTGFSSVKSRFEDELQEATKEASDNNEFAEAYDPASGDYVKLKPMSQEDVKKFYDYVVSINTSFNFDMEVSNIINEEASAFFAGQKSAEDVAKIIQKRVSVYINETH
ncbi:MAG: extracellular solute-binding protein [Butyrivibrio sp.]|nr:extracellular solute-binding protein [Butyrivibrio sp.]